jgi:hypothetical protein
MVYASGPSAVTLRAAAVLENRDGPENFGDRPDGPAKQLTERGGGFAANAKRRFHMPIRENQNVSGNKGA